MTNFVNTIIAIIIIIIIIIIKHICVVLTYTVASLIWLAGGFGISLVLLWFWALQR